MSTLQYFKKKSLCPQKLFRIGPNFFFRIDNQPKSHVLFHKNGSLCDFYIMTLLCLALPILASSFSRSLSLNLPPHADEKENPNSTHVHLKALGFRR